MPMDFPDFDSLRNAASLHKFRKPAKKETEKDFRRALADHVVSIDVIEAGEIRTGVGWDRWTDQEKAEVMFP